MVDDFNLPLEQVRDLRHVVRKLNWFQRSVAKEAEALGKKYGYAFAVDNRTLAAAFLKWAEAFEIDHSEAPRNRMEFAIFSGGLMLRELLRATPVKASAQRKATERLPDDPTARICDFWPEGFFYAAYCLTLVRAVLKSDFHTNAALDPSFEDMRVWQSFRENAAHDVGLAVPFFDLFLGRDPNWAGPEFFLSRPALRGGARGAASAETSTERD
jgi:hypothetical protein